MRHNDAIIRDITGRGMPLPGDDIDTDQILPAWFMKCVTFEHMGQYAFHGARFDSDGKKKDHPFNDSRFRGSKILIVGRNFGCGSSREHAPQSLARFGFKAIVGESFAEIFAGNCTAIGVPTLTADKEKIEELMRIVRERSETEIRIDLEARRLNAGSLQIPVRQPEQVRNAFLEGSWDSTAELVAAAGEIRALADRLPYRNGFCSNQPQSSGVR